jgi:D-alanyl-D-alanine carboxypeptidase/D-alanyl-D-alanine-endopeptidase (penicillin-binding protein 4)
VPFYTVINNSVTAKAGSRPSPGLDRPPGSRQLRLFGSLPAGGRPLRLDIAIDDPAAFAASAFAQMLRARGVAIGGQAVAVHRPATETASFEQTSLLPVALDAGRPGAPAVSGAATGSAPGLASGSAAESTAGFAGPSPSAPAPSEAAAAPAAPRAACRIPLTRPGPWLEQDVLLVNKASQNLHAEMLLRLLGLGYGGEGSFLGGVRVVRGFLLAAGLDGDDFFLYDGSGVSRGDLITPRALTTLLVYAAGQPWGARWRATLPVGGGGRLEGGTLGNRFLRSPLKGRIFAKTGTHGEDNALSGYLLAASGRTLAFSILVNNHRPGETAVREAVDRVAEAIAAAY